MQKSKEHYKLMINLAEKVRQSIKNSRYSQKEIAKLLNVAPETISRYINNKHEPPINFLKELAIVTNTPLNWYLEETDTSNAIVASVIDTLGKRIRYCRDSILNQNQEEFAKSLELNHRGTISSWEKDKNEPMLKQLVKIAKLADVSLDWLITGRVESKHHNINNNNCNIANSAGQKYKVQQTIQGTMVSKDELEDLKNLIQLQRQIIKDKETIIELLKRGK